MVLRISISPAQEIVLTKVVNAVNAQRASEPDPLPPITIDQFITDRLAQVMASYKGQIAAVNKQLFAQAFQQAPPDVQGQVKDLLGLYPHARHALCHHANAPGFSLDLPRLQRAHGNLQESLQQLRPVWRLSFHPSRQSFRPQGVQEHQQWRQEVIFLRSPAAPQSSL